MNGNGKTTTFPRLSDSRAAEARALIWRYELDCSRQEMLDWVDRVMTLNMTEELRCYLLRTRVIEIYAEAEDLNWDAG